MKRESLAEKMSSYGSLGITLALTWRLYERHSGGRISSILTETKKNVFFICLLLVIFFNADLLTIQQHWPHF